MSVAACRSVTEAAVTLIISSSPVVSQIRCRRLPLIFLPPS